MFFPYNVNKNHVPNWALGFGINPQNFFPICHAHNIHQVFFTFRFHIFRLKLINHLDYIGVLRGKIPVSLLVFPNK